MRRHLFALGFVLAAGNAEAATVIGNSELLTAGYAGQIESWLIDDDALSYDGSISLTNIWTKASGNDTSADFHAAADGQGSTITLVEAILDGVSFVLGGFNPQSWNSSATWNFSDPAERVAFIFNLTTGVRQDQTQGPQGIYQTYNGSDRWGPVFGGGDLQPYAQASDLPLDYGQMVAFSYCSGQCDSTNLLGTTDIAFFEVGRIEVFTIGDGPISAVPLPPALPLFAAALAGTGLLGWRRRRAA